MKRNQETLLISIIVAVLNNSKSLQRCIDSVVNQTYSFKELIIIDGGSNITISENIITYNGEGIYLSSSSNNSISSNSFLSNNYGIYLNNSNNNRIF